MVPSNPERTNNPVEELPSGSVPVMSIVIPARNESRRIGPTLEALLSAFAGRSIEIVVVDDHSTDDTAAVVTSHTPGGDAQTDARPTVRLIPGDPGRFGKGAALRAGIAAAHADVVVLLDADLPVSIDTIDKLVERTDDVSVVLGSRRLERDPSAQPLFRRIGGSSFLAVTRGLGFKGVSDPQCGLKVLRGPTAKAAAAQCGADGFAFDLEFLMRCQRQRIVMAEVPIRWIHRPGSTVRPIRDALVTIIHLVGIRANLAAQSERTSR